MEELMESVLDNTATMRTLDLIEKTAINIKNSADCAIGFESARMILAGFEGFKEDYISHLINLDQPVRVLDPKGEFGGIALGIDNHGQLLVKTKENGVVPVYAGEVSVRGLYEYV